MTEGGVYMSARDLFELSVIEDFRSGRRTRVEAATVLGCCLKSVTRKSKRLREGGPGALRHGNRGRTPSNKTVTPVMEAALRLALSLYPDFNLTHCHEMLVANHGLNVKYSTFHAWCRRSGIKQGKRRRPSKRRLYRERMANEGLMLQMDGSHHDWNGSDKWCLIGLIDDATSDMPAARFYDGETTWGCMKTLRLVIERKGIPEVIYTDEAGWAGGSEKRRHFSQFVRACEELGITVITTPSAESKGRIERAWRTIQGRLVPELRLHGIKSMTDANRYLDQVFLPGYWAAKRTVLPRDQISRYRRLPVGTNLDQILCLKYWRIVRRDHTVSYDGKEYRILGPNLGSLAGKDVTVHIDEEGEAKWFYGHLPLETKLIIKPIRKWTRDAG